MTESKTRQRKYLLVITKGNWGGAQAYLVAEALYLHGRGDQVWVASGETPGARGILMERLAGTGINFVTLKYMQRDIQLSNDIRAVAELYGVIRHLSPDVVHLNSTKAGLVGSIAARLYGRTRIVFTAHGWAHRETRSGLAKYLIKILSWVTIALSDRVIAVSNLDYDDAPVMVRRHKLAIVHNGVGEFSLYERERARDLLSNLNKHLDKSKFWILAIAELHPNKGIDVLITAIAQMPIEARAGIQVLVMGDGECRNELARQAETAGLGLTIFLLGFVEQARSFLLAADLFVLPSRKEGLPLALIEAGLAQNPVVATNTGGVPEIISSGEAGLIVPPGDPKALSRALLDMITDKPRRLRSGARLRRVALGKFREDVMLDRTAAILDAHATY